MSEPANAAVDGMGTRSAIVAALPLAAAVAVFGVLFGAAARAHMELVLVVAMSLLVFSGSLQFTVVGLLASGAGAPAILLTALVLNARHVVLGAVLAPRVHGTRLRRAVLAWFLVDESFGLAIGAGRRAALVLLLSGALLFAGWQAGTIVGALGASAVDLAEVAAAAFPVLFIGLAAVTVRGRLGWLRAGAAALAVAVLSMLVPAISAYLPIMAALLVALPDGRRR